MKLIVNGHWRETAAASLAAALGELGFDGKVVVTAVNGEFVPASRRRETPLAEGDRVEVLAPMGGG